MGKKEGVLTIFHIRIPCGAPASWGEMCLLASAFVSEPLSRNVVVRVPVAVSCFIRTPASRCPWVGGKSSLGGGRPGRVTHLCPDTSPDPRAGRAPPALQGTGGWGGENARSF